METFNIQVANRNYQNNNSRFYILLRRFFLILFTTLSYLANSQTLILVVRTKDSLWVGADSRIKDLDSQKYDTVCKIFKTGNNYFTFTGFSFEGLSQNQLSYFSENSSVKEKTSQYLRNRYPQLLATLKKEWQLNNKFYKENFSQFKWGEALFFGLENDTIVTRQAVFELISDSLSLPVIDTSNTNLEYIPPEKILIHPAGHINAVDSLLKKENVWANGIVEGIKILMRAQSNSTPESVAFPIDIIYITKKSQKWINTCGKCTGCH